jgi:predicted cupin superfamily sugar epimerase
MPMKKAEAEGHKRVETFVVGHDVEKGERLQWIVPGGKFKASFLLPDEEGGTNSEGLLISETIVPGFEFCNHDFLGEEGLRELVGEARAEELKWLLRGCWGIYCLGIICYREALDIDGS